MTRIAIAAAMLAAAMGSAFADGDHFVPLNINRMSPANPPSAAVDNGVTMSIRTHVMGGDAARNEAATKPDPAQSAPDLGLSIWTQ